MTQPRRADELALYALLSNVCEPATAHGTRLCLGSVVRQAAATLGIPLNRACYLVDKWESKGWYETSSFPPGGWFTKDAPHRLTQVGHYAR